MGPIPARGDGNSNPDTSTATTRSVLEKLRADGLKRSEAVVLATQMLSISKSAVYRMALEMDDWG